MTRLVVAQLAAGSPPGLLLPWARSRRFEVDLVRPDLGDPLPLIAAADGVVLLGADASVRDTWLSWLAPVRAWTAEALALDVPVLGIGLGAQIIASVLGAEPVRASRPSVGWVRVRDDEAGVPSGPWLTYGEDLGRTEVLRAGPHLGVPFHAQATPDVVRAWARDGRFDVPDGLVEEVEERIVEMARNARALFGAWAAGAGLDAPAPATTVRVGG